MKKLVLTLSVVLILAACSDFNFIFTKRPVTINNHSNQTVDVTLTVGSGNNNYNVKPNDSFSFDLSENFSHKMASYQSSPIIDSVYFNQEGDTYNFYDITPFPASIYNTLGKDVILSGNGAISTDPLVISAGQEIKTQTIKSNSPSFSAQTTDGYQVQVDFNFDGTTFKIILR